LPSSGVLNVSRLTRYDKIPLIYSTASTIKDLEQDANGDLVWNNDVITTTPSLNTALTAKQHTLTAGDGIFFNGSTSSSYGLRWLTNGTPTITQKDLHFKTGFSVAETINLSSGNNELAISVATQGISDITGLQTALNAKQDNTTAGEGVFLNSNTLTSYFLRYKTGNTNPSTPASNVHTLLLKDLDVLESINSNSEYHRITIL